jgi:hypothetical protein
VGLRAGLDDVVKRKILPCQKLNCSHPVHSLVTKLTELSKIFMYSCESTWKQEEFILCILCMKWIKWMYNEMCLAFVCLSISTLNLLQRFQRCLMLYGSTLKVAMWI